MTIEHKISDLGAFCLVAKYEGFTAASNATDMPKSSLSMAVKRLEKILGLRLLERTTRKIRLTEAGRNLYLQVDPLFSRIHHVTSEIQAQNSQITGSLRIASPYEFGAHHVAIAAESLIASNPRLKLCIDVRYAPVAELFAMGYDIVFVMSEDLNTESNAVSCKLFTIRRGLFASPELLAKYPDITTPEDLRRLPVITSPHDTRWHFHDSGKATKTLPVYDPVIASSNADIRRHAAISGLGIARITASFCADAVSKGKLVQILPEYANEPLQVYGLVNDRRLMPTKVRALFSLMNYSTSD